MKLQIISIFIPAMLLVNISFAESKKTDCKERAEKAVLAIEGLYGDTTSYKLKKRTVTKLPSESLSEGNHEVTGATLYQINVDYGVTTGKYFVTISNSFPDFECVVSNVQYLGNVLNK